MYEAGVRNGGDGGVEDAVVVGAHGAYGMRFDKAGRVGGFGLSERRASSGVRETMDNMKRGLCARISRASSISRLSLLQNKLSSLVESRRS